jgi:hypothetical protein
MRRLLVAALSLITIAGISTAQGPKTNSSSAGKHRNYTDAEVQTLFSSFGLDPSQPSVVGCAVLDPNATPTNQVPVFDFGQQAYWLKYASRGVFASNITFTVRPLFTGSPLSGQRQTFALASPDDTDISTPFGIPNWALDATAGPWALIVQNDLGDRAACRFTVVP